MNDEAFLPSPPLSISLMPNWIIFENARNNSCSTSNISLPSTDVTLPLKNLSKQTPQYNHCNTEQQTQQQFHTSFHLRDAKQIFLIFKWNSEVLDLKEITLIELVHRKLQRYCRFQSFSAIY